VTPVAISSDDAPVTEELKRKAGYTFTFLSDPKAGVIRKYDLLHKGAGEDGRDIARPAEILVDRAGVVRWVNLTDDYRVRARPEQLLDATKVLR
jgi:peroxiredoxin